MRSILILALLHIDCQYFDCTQIGTHMSRVPILCDIYRYIRQYFTFRRILKLMNITRYIFTAAIYMLSSVIVSTFIYNTPASAASDGLKLSTSRQSISVKPGDSTATRLNITNESPRPMDVLLGVQAFIVDPATHAVNFSTPKETWVTPHLPRITLAPGASQEITYRIAVPAVASEQEYHFALVASTTIQQGDSTRTLRVASLLYLYADGGHLRRSSDITDVKIPSFVVTGDIPYGFTIKNTGNIHIEARTTTQLQASQHTDTDIWHNSQKSSALRRLERCNWRSLLSQ